MGHHVVVAAGIPPAKGQDVPWVERVRGPFTLDCSRWRSPSRENEVDFMPALVSPVVHRSRADDSMELIENRMLPKGPHVISAQRVPPAVVAHETSVEAVHLGRCHDLRFGVSTEWANHVSYVRGRKNLQIVADGGAANLTRSGVARRLEDSATVGE